MKHHELIKARIINQIDDTRRYLLLVRKGIDSNDPILAKIRATIDNLEEITALVDEGHPHMIAFDGVFYLRKEDSEAFRERYKAHKRGNA
jgi:hypothetical protein